MYIYMYCDIYILHIIYILYISYIYIYIYITYVLYMYNLCLDLLKFEYCVFFLEPKFFFHINALRGEVNPQFLKIR